MTDKIYTIEEIRNIALPILLKYNVGKVYLFGSYARGEADGNSDVDLRVDQTGNLGLDLYVMQDELTDALQKQVDLLHTEHLRKQLDDPWTQYFVRQMKKSEVLLYAKS